jgi:hypothetical protein
MNSNESGRRQSPHDASPAPSDMFLEERRRKYHNVETVETFAHPDTVKEGDSIVHFRRSDVIVAGDIFTTTHIPSSI